MTRELFDIQGKQVLLFYPEKTYGQEIAKELHNLGAHITLCGSENDSMIALVKELGLAPENIIHYEPGTEKSAEALSNKVSLQMGAPDALVYIDPGSTLDTWTPGFEELYASLRISQLGLMLTVKHLGLLMAQANRGSVVFVTDYGALVGYDPQNYLDEPQKFDRDFTLDRGFAAGSFVNYARQAAGFLGEHNIRCNVLAFGPLYDANHVSFGQSIIKHSHLKRLPTEEDLAGAVAFFVSDASSFITGVTLPVDGGYTAK